MALTGLLVLPLVGLAAPPEVSPETAPTAITNAVGLVALIERIGNWIFAILVTIASVFLIYAGFLWTTAGGDPQKATKARTILIDSLIGVVVALLARGLVLVVKSIVGTGA